MFNDNPDSFLREEIEHEDVKLEVDGQEEIEHYSIQDTGIDTLSRNEAKCIKFDTTEYSADTAPFENIYSEGDTVIKNDSLLYTDMYHYNLDLPLKRKRKKHNEVIY